jgi:hypothetical protein
MAPDGLILPLPFNNHASFAALRYEAPNQGFAGYGSGKPKY